MIWIQRSLSVLSVPGSMMSITKEILDAMPEIRELRTGFLNLFLQHTSASITINEDADPDVPGDLKLAMNHLVPETLPFRHTLEGADDMPSHVKSSFIGVSVNVPVGEGRLLLGTWQGIFLCEHRRSKHRRLIVLTLIGERVK